MLELRLLEAPREFTLVFIFKLFIIVYSPGDWTLIFIRQVAIFYDLNLYLRQFALFFQNRPISLRSFNDSFIIILLNFGDVYFCCYFH